MRRRWADPPSGDHTGWLEAACVASYMARLAGMTLRERWSGWNHEPFTSHSSQHVSVWEKTA